ncbi:WD40 repeat-like protein [Lindgomyces ingoldianus]|uniref:WD40 repeat-like protein n=1 Tax=Lindgomyces ingoldianus TaxID=673940 RepID=A0ACB6QPM3_9PLEO|nr:WD40 repeat-like protein [Lindgomyces ingoldianus]KAF2468825.1 WD40 repeat-like protein [Lindgomyces ingoldianus]
MAEVLPKIQVTDPQSKDKQTLERQDTGKLLSKGEGPLAGAKLAVKLASPTSNGPQNSHQLAQNGHAEPEDAIDPLSQQILQRTSTSSAVQKLRTQTDNASTLSPTSPSDAYPDTKLGTETSREINGGSNAKQEKKKGVSFLSRIIGNKRKGTLDGATEDDSETGDSRPEGMNAKLFSHTVDNLGFSPKHPQPPAYIKVRAKFKKEKEFNRVFLAQELRSRADKKARPATGSNPAPQSGAAATHNPIWATEFSKDGKYLAAGGQDRIVRVWAVISTPEERRAHEKEESGPSIADDQSTHLSAPVFQQKTFREYCGHTSTILDLSWSKNSFLLSSSMDKTVRLWHISRSECLCTFKHTDFVPSIQFHPRDDRFFLAGSLDTKLRLWSIPDKSVAFWNQLPDMITAVSFTPDGKTCIAGTLSGLCMFYETEGLKYQTQIHVKSTRGQNAKGSKITGIQATYWPPGSNSGEVKLLISSNDSRVRMYNFRDKSLEVKFRGHENNCSQIRASFADDTGYIICGSEDRKAYIWSTCAPEGEKRNQRPLELFDAHNSITTCTILAPLKTRQLLSNSEDPIYDLCNPPPVTLISRAESINSSKPPTEAGGSAQATPAAIESTFRRVAESPAYIARSAHPDGNIIVTADHTGAIKVFRQDCAYMKRIRASDTWDTASVFSKKVGPKTGRPSSILSRTTRRTRRDSTSTQPPNDRIMSWRQDISHGGFDSVNGPVARRSRARSVSPRKPGSMGMGPPSIRATESPVLGPRNTTDTFHSNTAPKMSLSVDRTLVETSNTSTLPRNNGGVSNFEPVELQSKQSTSDNPLSVYNGQSWAFWNNNTWKEQMAKEGRLATPERPEFLGRVSTISKLSDELIETDSHNEAEGSVQCKKCGSEEFKIRTVRGIAGREDRRLVCTKCGTPAS